MSRSSKATPFSIMHPYTVRFSSNSAFRLQPSMDLISASWAIATQSCANFAWDSDLLSGYSSIFLERQANGGAKTAEEATLRGSDRCWPRSSRRRSCLSDMAQFSRASIVQALAAGCPLLDAAESTDHARTRRRWSSWLRDRILKALYARISGLLYVGQRSREHFLR